MNLLLWPLAVAAAIPAAFRWLRVAQREHYLAGSVSRFAVRWWERSPNPLLLGAGIVGLAAAVVEPIAGLVTMVAVAVGPLGLSLRGRTSPLRWTARLRRLTAGFAALWLAALAGGALAGSFLIGALVACLALPVLLDAAAWLIAPVERALGQRFVAEATRKLHQIGPVVVGITGSYGKTSTKHYVGAILRGHRGIVASPASFNNAMGLSRAVNEGLTPGAEVFVAEMGTYGPGEIREMCGWMKPVVGVITSIGPVHLERFGSLETTLASKAEILEGVAHAVLNIDDGRLAALADTLDVPVVRCSAADPSADVFVEVVEGGGLTVHVGGEEADRVPAADLFATNVACAYGVAVALDVPVSGAGERLAALPAAPHRREVTTSDQGFVIVDDTYNSNPAGARAALELLTRHRGRRVVVTPGMVELGPEQDAENRRFAAEAAALASDVVIVGHTNRAALVEGTVGGGASVKLVEARPDAVAWVRSELGHGDAVLYENDLPDHYP